MHKRRQEMYVSTFIDLFGIDHIITHNYAFMKTTEARALWQLCYEQEERWAIAEIEKLTNNQQTLLKGLALQPTHEPTGRDFSMLTGMSLSSIRMGVKSLLEKDLIYQTKKEDVLLSFLKAGEYRVLDPLIAYGLRKYS